jgi:MFS family permease
VAGLVERVAPARLGRPFRWLLGSNWASNLGDGLSVTAGPLLVASLTQDPRVVAVAAAIAWVPGFAMGLYAGALADRLDRRRIILVGNVIRVLTLAGLATAVALGRATIGLILAVLAIIAIAETFVDAASRTVLPAILPPAELGLGNARLTFGWVALNQLVGPPIGALLFAAYPAAPFVVQTGAMALGALLIARVRLPAPPPRERRHLWHEIREGLGWTWRHRAMRALVLQIVLFNLTYGASWGVLVLYAAQRLGLDERGFGALAMVTALGGVLGTVTYPWLTERVSLADIMRYGLVLETGTHLVLALTRNQAVALGILFLFGIHIAYWATTASAIRQRAVPAQLQGRVGSVYTMAMLGGMVGGSMIGGTLAAQWGITAPYWFGFVGSAVILAGLWRELGFVAHADAARLADADADADGGSAEPA